VKGGKGFLLIRVGSLGDSSGIWKFVLFDLDVVYCRVCRGVCGKGKFAGNARLWGWTSVGNERKRLTLKGNLDRLNLILLLEF
jgi:hypothetical protein